MRREFEREYETLFLTYAIPHIRYSSHTLFLTYAIPHTRYSSHTLFLTYAIPHTRYSSHTLFLMQLVTPPRELTRMATAAATKAERRLRAQRSLWRARVR
jgi:hypothetical protein